MESWRLVWRDGISPQLSLAGLLALKGGLETNDCRLLQGATTEPPPLLVVMDWKCEAACAVGYAFLIGDKGGNATVGEVEAEFARVLTECDLTFGEPAACRHWLNGTDDMTRSEYLWEVLAEVELAVSKRSRHVAAT